MSSALEVARAKSRVWFYAPQFYWFGVGTLSPILINHDEYARRTLVIGWTITGRIIFAIGVSPILINHDEYARRTLVIGWTITGRIIFAIGECGSEECKQLAEEDAKKDIENGFFA